MKKLIVVLFSLLALPAGAQITMQGGVTLIGGGGGGACTNCALTTSANAFTQTNIFPALTVTNGVNGLPLYENQGLFNIGLGVDSTPSTATGSQNLGIGDGTQPTLTSGYDNVSLGVAANGSVTTGFENTAFGTFALQNNVTGGGNDAQGSLALADALGNNNTAQGEESLSTLVTGNNNAAVGAFSGCGTLCSSGSGPINTLNNGIYFGYQTGASANNLTNQLLIGYNIQSSLSNYMQLGNSAITAATIYGAPTFPSLQSAGTQCAELTATGLLAGTGSACGSGGGTYPGAGVANSTGSAWGTSYQVGTAANDLVQLNGSAALPAVSGANLTALTAANISSGTAGISVTGNAATATVASGLTGSPAITVSNVTDSALTSGDCVQATTGGLLVTTANPCGTGSGSGITTQTNSTNNASQSVLNFTTTSTIAFSNPSGGLEEATIVSPGANTVLGFNGSNAYAGFTAGTGISLASGLITNTGITGTLGTANCIVKEATSSTVTCADATDNGTIFSITDSGGLQVVSSLPGLSSLGAGTGTFSSPCTNCYGEVGPLTGGTAFWFQHANTATAGFELWAAPASLYGLNVTQSTFVHLPFHMDSVTSAAGLYPSGYQIAIAYPGTAGHFTSLQGAYQGGGCSTPPTINVADITQSTTGTALTLNATTGTPAENSQTLTWNAGDLVVIEVTGVGAGCTGAFHAVSADGLIP